MTKKLWGQGHLQKKAKGFHPSPWKPKGSSSTFRLFIHLHQFCNIDVHMLLKTFDNIFHSLPTALASDYYQIPETSVVNSGAIIQSI